MLLKNCLQAANQPVDCTLYSNAYLNATELPQQLIYYKKKVMVIFCIFSYVSTSLNSLKLILRNFAPVIKSNVTAPPSIGVDISREERFVIVI